MVPVDSDAKTCNLLILNTNQCVSTRYGEVNGAGDEIRTHDPYLGKVMLYP